MKQLRSAPLASTLLARVFAGALAFGVASASSAASAQEVADAPAPTSIDDLVRWAEGLRSEDAAVRADAFEHLSHLEADAFDALDERIAYTRRQIVPLEDGYDALRFFRHATGSRNAADEVDIAEGVLATLAERRTTVIARVAERLAYLRSLERLGTPDAQRRIGDVLSLTNGMWRWEQRRLVDRMGVRILPGLLFARKNADRGVRRWAQWATDHLNLRNPADAIRHLQEHPTLLAAAFEGYADSREMDAMAVIISFVGHHDARIREGARKAMEAYGQNGIWQLRLAFRNQLGEDANASWGWRRTMRHLYEGLDAVRLQPTEEALNAGLEASTAGDFEAMHRHFGEVLRLEPLHPRRPDIAAAYANAALSGALTEAQALPWLRRAFRLAPEAADADVWRAAVLVAEADALLEGDFLDARGYRQAASLDPNNRRAAEVIADLANNDAPQIPTASTAEQTPAALPRSSLFGALLMLLAALGLGFALKKLLPLVKRRLAAKRQPRSSSTPAHTALAAVDDANATMSVEADELEDVDAQAEVPLNAQEDMGSDADAQVEHDGEPAPLPATNNDAAHLSARLESDPRESEASATPAPHQAQSDDHGLPEALVAGAPETPASAKLAAALRNHAASLLAKVQSFGLGERILKSDAVQSFLWRRAAKRPPSKDEARPEAKANWLMEAVAVAPDTENEAPAQAPNSAANTQAAPASKTANARDSSETARSLERAAKTASTEDSSEALQPAPKAEQPSGAEQSEARPNAPALAQNKTANSQPTASTPIGDINALLDQTTTGVVSQSRDDDAPTLDFVPATERVGNAPWEAATETAEDALTLDLDRLETARAEEAEEDQETLDYSVGTPPTEPFPVEEPLDLRAFGPERPPAEVDLGTPTLNATAEDTLGAFAPEHRPGNVALEHLAVGASPNTADEGRLESPAPKACDATLAEHEAAASDTLAEHSQSPVAEDPYAAPEAAFPLASDPWNGEANTDGSWLLSASSEKQPPDAPWKDEELFQTSPGVFSSPGTTTSPGTITSPGTLNAPS